MELLEDNSTFNLHVTECYYTGNTLFFIPVLPVYYMMRERKNRKAARLLLCVFSYLYHKAGVPYYTADDSYLCWHYDMIAEWLTNDPDDWEQGDYNNYISQLRTALHYGETMERRIWNGIHLDRFAEWLDEFLPVDDFGRQCQNLARKFYALWQDYPEMSLYHHADSSCLPDPDEDGYDDNDCITMEKYISFVAATEGWLYQNVQESVNAYFNECLSKQEPVLKRCFDGQPQPTDTLGYECRLFPLINELCYLLNNCDYGNRC